MAAGSRLTAPPRRALRELPLPRGGAALPRRDRPARGGRTPALLADAERVDHIEVVEIDGGEVVLFWDRPPHAATRLARALREELSQMQADEFLARWSTVEP